MRRILVTALAAGFAAGLAFFAVQAWRLLPLIQTAETYESAATPHHDHDAAAPTHQHAPAAEPAWEPAEGFERLAYTLTADVVTGIGFALLLVGAFSLRGKPIDLRRGLLWGIAGYLAFALAPALVLPPELPGSISADLAGRQAWWWATALATAGGLALVAFARPSWLKLAGVCVIVLPHVIAPSHPAGGVAPRDLLVEFTIASLAATAVFWIVLGAASGWLYPRLSRR
jgi:cobalt transporter subunit CbtA